MRPVHFAAAAAAVAMVGLATPAEARRSQREGFNFGTTVRLLDNSERTNGDGDTTRKSRVEVACQTSRHRFRSVLLVPGVCAYQGTAADEQPSIACQTEISVGQIGVPDHERAPRKDPIDV